MRGGAVTAEQMRHLQSLEVAAAAEGRYEDASYLQRLQRTIDPSKPQLTYEDCAPEAPEAAAEFFLEHGFVIVRGALSPERLARVQAAWAQFAGPARAAWEEHKRHCHGIARHYHDQVEEGWTQVARKWYGITDECLQPDYYGSAPPPMVETSSGSNVWHNGKGFLEVDEAFIDVVQRPSLFCVSVVRAQAAVSSLIPCVCLSRLITRGQSTLRSGCLSARRTARCIRPVTPTSGGRAAASSAALGRRPAPTRRMPTARATHTGDAHSCSRHCWPLSISPAPLSFVFVTRVAMLATRCIRLATSTQLQALPRRTLPAGTAMTKVRTSGRSPPAGRSSVTVHLSEL
eukprot:SAG22_NODE_4034_length_1414_cov_2.077567_2_plen_345_part_00